MKANFYTNKTTLEVEKVLKKAYYPGDSARLSREIRAIFLGGQMRAIYNALGYDYKSTRWVIKNTDLPERSISSSLQKLEAVGLVTSIMKSQRRFWKKI